MSLPATDTFTGTPGAGLSANWTTQVSGFLINGAGDAVKGVNTSVYQSAFWSADSFNNDQYAEITTKVFSTQSGPMVRMSGTGAGLNGFLLICRSDGVNTTIYEATNGSFTLLSTLAIIAWASTDVARLEISGTTLTAYRNGGSIGTGTSSAHPSGSAGMFLLDGSDEIDTWSGGNLGAVGDLSAFPGEPQTGSSKIQGGLR